MKERISNSDARYREAFKENAYKIIHNPLNQNIILIFLIDVDKNFEMNKRIINFNI